MTKLITNSLMVIAVMVMLHSTISYSSDTTYLQTKSVETNTNDEKNAINKIIQVLAELQQTQDQNKPETEVQKKAKTNPKKDEPLGYFQRAKRYIGSLNPLAQFFMVATGVVTAGMLTALLINSGYSKQEVTDISQMLTPPPVALIPEITPVPIIPQDPTVREVNLLKIHEGMTEKKAYETMWSLIDSFLTDANTPTRATHSASYFDDYDDEYGITKSTVEHLRKKLQRKLMEISYKRYQ